MIRPKVIILRAAGTNCDKETAFAFSAAGADIELVHINELTGRRRELSAYHILALPGGFTYGDDIASGKILANELRYRMEDALQRFVKSGRLIIGICNGFQILVKAGLLPNLAGDFQTIEATLTLNDSNKFEDRWVFLKRTTNPAHEAKGGAGDERRTTKCIWTEGIDKIIHLPVAHGEGKFIPKDRETLNALKRHGLVTLEYVDEKGERQGYPANPNGSVDNIAGICDMTGRIFGLMPHPERHISIYQGPYWTRMTKKIPERGEAGDGFTIFKNGVNFAKKYL